MWALGVHAGNQQADAVRPPPILLGVGLRAVGDAGGDFGEGDRAVVGQAGGEGRLLREVGEDAGVGGEAGERDAEVRVYRDDFLLVGREFFGVSLRGELVYGWGAYMGGESY